LEPGVASQGANNGVLSVGGVWNCIYVVRHFLNISLESLEWDIALMLNVLIVLLETKYHSFIDVPALAALQKNVGL
jgi:hypothetical protein